jgi:hypothetical protein
MDEINWLNILKWVLIVLLAGFIGQFGKTFAKHLMEKARLKRGEADENKTVAAIPRDTLKGTGSISDQGRAPSPEEATDRAKQGKKLTKAVSKQKKKEAKNLAKEEK